MIKTAEATQTAKQAYAAKLRQVLRRFDRLEETTVSDMIKALNVFRRDVISLLSGLPSDDEFNAFRLGALKDELDNMIPVLNTQLTQIANGAVMSGGRLGHETITEPLIAAGVTTFYNTPSLALINALQDWTADRITGITEETRKAISGEIRRVGLGGISPFQAMQNITRLMGFEPRGAGKYVAKGIGYNAERIARTETNRALNLGAFTQSQEVARETPEAQKRWNATGDFRTRSAHLSAHGQLRPLDEPFNVGGELLAYPLDPAGSGKNTINCRCRMTIVHPDIGVVGGPLDGQIGAERKRRDTATAAQYTPVTSAAGGRQWLQSKGISITGAYDSLDTEQINAINRGIMGAGERYSGAPITKLHIIDDFNGPIARASAPGGGRGITVNRAYFNQAAIKDFTAVTDYRARLAEAEALIASGSLDEYDLEIYNKRIARYQRRIQGELNRGVPNDLTDIIYHEYGHIVYNDLDGGAFPEFTQFLGTAETRDRFGISWEDTFYGDGTFTKWMETAAPKLSEYATTNDLEFMAESFTAFMQGNEQNIPSELLDVFNGITK